MPDGSQIVTLIDQLNAALKEAGIERNRFGEKYSLYSLRHFYAVMRLRNGIGVFEVARNMGTSVQMIQEYYGKQATSAVFATRLGGFRDTGKALVINPLSSGGRSSPTVEGVPVQLQPR